MVIEAFVLPYLGRSAGVVFWEPRRGGAARGRLTPGGRRAEDPGPAEADALTVYAPGELSPGELAELQGSYVASLGQALREAGAARAGGGPLRWWWLGGLSAAAALALRALEFAPGYAWLALVVAVTALPRGTAGVAWPTGRGRVALARRLTRRAARLVPAGGADPRAQERLDGLWRLARRLQGPPGQQLRELEAYCREQAWLQGAQFYGDELSRLGAFSDQDAPRRPGWGCLLALWRGGPGPRRAAPYAVTEMRAW